MPISDRIDAGLSGMMLQLAGEVGQVSLARSADDAGARASVDQHASELRDLLARDGRRVTTAALLGYAQGFAEAAIARGWSPAARHERDPWEDYPPLDWESLRFAAICRLFLETQGLGITD